MRQRIVLALLTAAGAAATAAVVWTAPSASPERVIAAMLLVLVVPGAALSRLFAWTEGTPAGGGLVLVGALSLAVVVMDSVILYLAGIRLDDHSWAASLGGVSLVCSLLGVLRPMTRPQLRGRGWVSRWPLLVGALASGAILAAAVLITIQGVRSQDGAERFTQLWALPTPGAPAATIGVFNHEGAPKSYVLTIYQDGRVRSVQPLTVRSRAAWTSKQTFGSGIHRVRITLSLGDSSSVYRTVHLTLGSSPSSAKSPS
jgi:hypothetical protein